LAKAPKWVTMLAFSAGFAWGRESSAKEVKTPPRVEFVYPESGEEVDIPSPEELENYIVEELASMGISVDRAAVRERVNRIHRRMRLVALRGFYLSMIAKLTDKFARGEIERYIYVSRVRSYIRKLQKVERELQEIRVAPVLR